MVPYLRDIRQGGWKERYYRQRRSHGGLTVSINAIHLPFAITQTTNSSRISKIIRGTLHRTLCWCRTITNITPRDLRQLETPGHVDQSRLESVT